MRIYRIEFLGAIPKAARIGFFPLTSSTIAGRYEFDLRKVVRYQLLAAKAKTICQRIAKFHLDRNPATYGFNTWYPLLPIHFQLRGDPDAELPDSSINRHAHIYDPSNLILKCQQRVGAAEDRVTADRMAFNVLFPKKVWVSEQWRLHLRFLSFATTDYQDRINQAERENNRKRKLEYSGCLTTLVENPLRTVETMTVGPCCPHASTSRADQGLSASTSHNSHLDSSASHDSCPPPSTSHDQCSPPPTSHGFIAIPSTSRVTNEGTSIKMQTSRNHDDQNAVANAVPACLPVCLPVVPDDHDDDDDDDNNVKAAKIGRSYFRPISIDSD